MGIPSGERRPPSKLGESCFKEMAGIFNKYKYTFSRIHNEGVDEKVPIQKQKKD